MSDAKFQLEELARLIGANAKRPRYYLVSRAVYDAYVAEFGAPPDGVSPVEDGDEVADIGGSLASIFDGDGK